MGRMLRRISIDSLVGSLSEMKDLKKSEKTLEFDGDPSLFLLMETRSIGSFFRGHFEALIRSFFSSSSLMDSGVGAET